MKFLFGPLAMFRTSSQRRDVAVLVRFSVAVLVLMAVFMGIFRLLMLREGQDSTWITAFYWVLTTMSTLGYGDVTFDSDLGRFFSMVVLLSGMVSLLVLLPFLFIELFYIPWSERQKTAMTPREVPESLSGHVILTNIDTTAPPLRRMLARYGISHLLIHPDSQSALRLRDDGWQVMVGDLDLPETYRRAGAERAALIAATGSDAETAHVAFTVREIDQDVPIVGIANEVDSVDVLELAGCTEVIHLAERMGEALSRRVAGADTLSHTIGRFGDLLVAESSVRDTPWAGMTLQEAGIRRQTGASVVGIWERGAFKPPTPDAVLSERCILLLAASRSQLDLYDAKLNTTQEEAPVIIIGGGRVGRAAARAFDVRGVDYRIVEKEPSRVLESDKYIVGSGADIAILERAGISRTSTVIVTTRDDDLNVFLVIYCRRLRPDVQILSRASKGRNVETMHRAGADFVLSYATMGANAIFSHLNKSDSITVAEGLYLFRVATPEPLHGLSLAKAQVRPKTGATVVGIEGGGARSVNPDPEMPLPADSQLILIGDADSETRFLETYAS